MKYHIDTIPVWDAYHVEDQCPLCVMKYRSEKEYVDFFLSGSVMEPSTRIDVNRVGFCSNHFQLLYNEKNRLGLALITHTHLKETIERFDKLTNALGSEPKNLLSKFSSILPKRLDSQDTTLLDLLNWLGEHHDSCMICNRLENLLNRYAYTILHLWQKDPAFERTLKDSKGFCLHHFGLIMKIAGETLSTKDFNQWVEFIIPIEMKALEELEADLLWFTQKFDYRNQDKPWGNSRDALPRTIQKLSGAYMEAPALIEEKD
jgi:hypothetical protein